jgi:hypothetical protein
MFSSRVRRASESRETDEPRPERVTWGPAPLRERVLSVQSVLSMSECEAILNAQQEQNTEQFQRAFLKDFGTSGHYPRSGSALPE